MKKILYLTFYFEPDLCAGSFRNSPLVKELAHQLEGVGEIDVITTLPNRYNTYKAEASEFEERENYTVRRIKIPKHKSGMKDQIFSFKEYYLQVHKLCKNKKYDLVVASSSRLFTAYLGYKIAKKNDIPLFLDIRDIFYETIEDVMGSNPLKKAILPAIKKIEKKTFSYATHINLISGGFNEYFKSYKHAVYTNFPNGIDDIFIKAGENEKVSNSESSIRTIIYAGNIGESQGLHKIIPQAAQKLDGKVKFIIVGDGGAKQKLIDNINETKVSNVEIIPPVNRNELIDKYMHAHFLFAHLNDYKAFERVLPSKLFELAAINKPLIAGVGGFAAEFIKNYIENSILFEPCNVDQFVKLFNSYEYKTVKRNDFIKQFKRSTVNENLAREIMKYI